jgi:serine phosphatase RsbU (regulator of sigma subunit)
MHLLAQDPARFTSLSNDPKAAWEVFAGYVTAAVARILWEPKAARKRSGRIAAWWHRATATLAWVWPCRRQVRYSAYDVSSFYRPRDAVGGDVWKVSPHEEALWVFVADVSGKSWPAYILACGLPDLWDCCLCAAPTAPVDLMQRLEDQLRGCLPDGLFIEAAVGCFASGGAAEVTTAGGPLVLRHDAAVGKVQVHTLGGPLLGLGIPGLRDRGVWLLGRGDEVLLASDGVTARPFGKGGIERIMNGGALGGKTLHQVLVQALSDVLVVAGQEDDITVVTVRRR